MSVKVYKYSENFGRMGQLDSVFVAEESDVARMMGKRVYLGEVLGKHSEVSATITGDTVKVVSDDQAIVEFFVDHLRGKVGTDVYGAFLDQEADDDFVDDKVDAEDE
jgi:hypothetical protein